MEVTGSCEVETKSADSSLYLSSSPFKQIGVCILEEKSKMSCYSY